MPGTLGEPRFSRVFEGLGVRKDSAFVKNYVPRSRVGAFACMKAAFIHIYKRLCDDDKSARANMLSTFVRDTVLESPTNIGHIPSNTYIVYHSYNARYCFRR